MLDELRSFAMFGGAKLVVVRDADEFIGRYREPLEDYAAKPADSGTLVLRLASLPKNAADLQGDRQARRHRATATRRRTWRSGRWSGRGRRTG